MLSECSCVALNVMKESKNRLVSLATLELLLISSCDKIKVFS